ncbi:baseplate wedge protein, partial [archaeon]|nr:baseplate wedge protein [archaeon]
FLNTANLRDNVISHAENMGYVPRSAKSARAKISFVVPFGNGTTASSVTLKKGVVALSNTNDRTRVFSIVNDITKPISNLKSIFDSVEIFEGNLITQKFTVNTSLTDQRYVLNNENIDTTTITVKVKTSATEDAYTTYNQVDNIIGADSETPIFIIKEIRDENYEIIFGDGLIGKSLTNGNIIEVSYIVTTGEEANGIFNYILNASMQNNLGDRIDSTGIIPTVDQPSIGGSTIESVSSIKKYAGRYLSAQNRVVTSTDYETLIPKIFPKAKSAVAYGGETLNPPQYGKVFVSIKPDNSSFLSLFDKKFIKDELRKYSPLGIDVEIEDLKYLYLELTITA